MTGNYLDHLADLRTAFPDPYRGAAFDARLSAAIADALAAVNGLHANGPLVGNPVAFDLAAARQSRLANDPQSVNRVAEQLIGHFLGGFNPAHPAAPMNGVPPASIPGILGGLLAAIFNPNLASEEGGAGAAAAEIEAASISAALVGYDAAQSGGVFTFGGTGAILYGIRIGLEKALPGAMQTGVRTPAYVLCSDRAHHACRVATGWLGMGSDHLVQVPADAHHEIQTCLLETHCRDLLRSGARIAAIVATLGTTDAFGFDNLAAACEIRERLADEFHLDYRPHVHADAVSGWAFRVFTDYDFEQNPLGFPDNTLSVLADLANRVRHLHLADSIGVDFHKTGFSPLVSSLFLARTAADLALISRNRDSMPYLFQSGNYHPGVFTLETTRCAAGPLSALASLLLFGKNGWRSVLGHLVHLTQTLREQMARDSALCVLNGRNHGPVTLFRVYPNGVAAARTLRRERSDPAFRSQFQEYSDYNRRIFAAIQSAARRGEGVGTSFTDGSGETEFGEPICAMKSYILSPFADVRYAADLLESIDKARNVVAHRG